MLLYNVRKSSSGFTLIEMLVTITVVGVIAAIASPNFLGLLNRNRANEAMRQVEGAIKEAQRQALRTGKQCTINIDTTNKTITNPATNGCLLSTRVLNDSIQLNFSRTGTPPTITFSGKGNITINDADAALRTPVLVMSIPNNANIQKCVAVENVLGSIRTGDYSATIPTTPVADDCVNSP
jgi:prepilin-type N-terminal cleavage/methylation domain-containing protein